MNSKGIKKLWEKYCIGIVLDSVDWIFTAWKWFTNGAFAYAILLFTNSWIDIILPQNSKLASTLSFVFVAIYLITKVDMVYNKGENKNE